ncbi:hypothetical protein K4L06_19885 [Lysobacter sp. BMK333-48F3]|uniref:hypothetical protein n=1 Tax=Lysobacter sp. BMK333-48F3 TaxID=2867962 RepID=UPI001C8C0E7D|nr:hypothetical protein [Lysobacter sp. BMK333-48F3]MBX9403575.1 hypothetical protein [Lysobacter sp. BMK333-48F3]
MSNTQPTDAAPKRKGNGSKYLFLFLIGLVGGVVATVMAVRALDQRKDHFPDSVMHVQQWHLGQLKSRVEQNRCAATDTLPHVKALRTMADDLEPAFPDLKDDQRFGQHASKLRAALDGALASPPLNCAGVSAVSEQIGEACKACHQDFRG